MSVASAETVLPSTANPAATSYVEWPAIFAGAVLASAISAMLVAFGSAIGLSITSAWPDKGVSAFGFVIALTLWLIWVQVSSYAAGGYVAGRLRRRVGDGTAAESELRDGMHGVLVWALSTLIGAVLLALAAAGTVSTVTKATAALSGGAVGAASASMGQGSGQPGQAQGGGHADPIGYTVDTLFRAEGPAPTDEPPELRDEVARILLVTAAQGQIDPADKAYLARLVAARTGLDQPAAERRVDEVLTRADNLAKAAETKARQVAETARKRGMMLAFLTVASLLVSAAAAWGAAKLGGTHRNDGVHFGHYFRWFHR